MYTGTRQPVAKGGRDGQELSTIPSYLGTIAGAPENQQRLKSILRVLQEQGMAAPDTHRAGACLAGPLPERAPLRGAVRLAARGGVAWTLDTCVCDASYDAALMAPAGW